jgi:hypothetical protein
MNQTNSILIVGGGSSGWMTAALLSRVLPETRITLVESSDIPTIGVGESTNYTMHYFQRAVGLDEKAFMRASNAAFKIAIRFVNFNRPGGVFYHPFGVPQTANAGFFEPDAAAQFKSYHLAELGNQFSKECVYSYQIDAGLYGHHLKQVCTRRDGVRHVVDRIKGVELTETGEIARINTEKSGPLAADLYVDCSGFRSILLGGALGEPFESYSRFLLNDKAIAARIPYIDKERELVTYTNCTALSAGWVWNIPLWSRIGTGYVYCSGFLSAAQAEEEFRQFLGVERTRDAQFNHLDIRTGRHRRAWVKNCVGIGISYGFLEPLESTGLSLTQLSIRDLAAALCSAAPRQAQTALFNTRQAEVFDATRDFVMAHYVVTSRTDTPYWRHIRDENPMPDSLRNALRDAKNRSYETIEKRHHKFYEPLNWNSILSGMGYFGEGPASTPPLPLDRSNLSVHAKFLQSCVYDGDYSESPGDVPVQIGAHPSWYSTW